MHMCFLAFSHQYKHNFYFLSKATDYFSHMLLQTDKQTHTIIYPQNTFFFFFLKTHLYLILSQTTNFRLFQTENFNFDEIGRQFSKREENTADMSNFSFSNSVFKRLVLQTCKNQGLFGKGLKVNLFSWIYMSLCSFACIFCVKNLLFTMFKFCVCITHYHTTTHFDALKIYSCGKHWEKKRNCL